MRKVKLILKFIIGFFVLALFIGASFPNLSPKYQGINFIRLNAEEKKITNDVGVSIVEAQTQRFVPNKNLVPYSGKVPVLMYHVISNNFYKKVNENVLKVEDFQAQIKWLHDNGFNTITPDQLYRYVKEKSPLPPNPIMLSFDDGNKDSYSTVFPILKNYNFTATMFIITNAIGRKGKVNQEEINEMIDYGITIGSHTASHLNLASLSKDYMRKEIIDSKKTLENLFGVSINFLCYPSGRYDDMVLDIVKEGGYLAAFTTHFGRVSYGDDTLTLVRVRVSRSDSLNGFIQKIEHAKTYNFSTPHHGDKREKTPIDDGEIGLDNLNTNKKNHDKNKNKNNPDNNGEQPIVNTDKNKPNGDNTTNDNGTDIPSDNNLDNSNPNPNNPSDNNIISPSQF